jgi:hypothetical protein
MKIELSDDLVDEVIAKALTQIKDDLKVSIKKPRPLVFVSDAATDKKLIKKHIEAFELIIDYFTI